MSAETLRRAAALMRERTEKLPPSPWYPVEIGRAVATSREWVVDSPSRLVAGNLGLSRDPVAEPMAEHIASWHPAVALAVADWLDYAASYAQAGVAPSYTHYALAVARAYLGEQP